MFCTGRHKSNTSVHPHLWFQNIVLSPFYQNIKIKLERKLVLAHLSLPFPEEKSTIIDDYQHFPKDQPHSPGCSCLRPNTWCAAGQP